MYTMLVYSFVWTEKMRLPIPRLSVTIRTCILLFNYSVDKMYSNKIEKKNDHTINETREQHQVPSSSLLAFGHLQVYT